jgi:hypothetical protein
LDFREELLRLAEKLGLPGAVIPGKAQNISL